MTLGRLLLRNLFFYWRGNCAVLLGVALGAAVLTGALLVGDSLRGSLRDVILDQLGGVDQALVGGRFVREELAGQIKGASVSPAIIVQGSASSGGEKGSTLRRAGRVMIYGVDAGFWQCSLLMIYGVDVGSWQGSPPVSEAFWTQASEGLVLNSALAGELGVSVGDIVTLHLQKVTTVPHESLLGRRDASEVLEDLKLEVSAVIPAEGLGRFSLQPSPAVAHDAFVPLRLIQAKLRQNGYVNALLARGAAGTDVQSELHKLLTLNDWGLKLHTPRTKAESLFAKLDRDHDGSLRPGEYRRRLAESFVHAVDISHDGTLTKPEVLNYFQKRRLYASLESRQMLLEPFIAEAALAAAKQAGLLTAPTLVYLANGLSDGRHTIPYSVVAALDEGTPPDLGPFVPAGVEQLRDGEIALVDWKDSPLTVKADDTVTMTYFQPEFEGKLNEVTVPFRFRGLLPLAGAVDDPDLTPEFPGITDKLDLRDWNPPFPYDNKRVGQADERYWEEYRTIPKAFINLADGQKLWGSRFGKLTSIRLAVADRSPENLQRALDDFTSILLDRLQPEHGGLVFEPVRGLGVEGSSGSTDFGGLFLGFSSFLILAALLVVGLLFRLNIDQRASDAGLLFALGYRIQTLRRLLVVEGAVIAAVGGVVGLGGSVLYAWLMLRFLRAVWPGGLDPALLQLHATPLSLVIGYVSALVMSVLTIVWAVRILGRVAPRSLLTGETEEAVDRTGKPTQPRWSRRVAVVSGCGAILCLILGTQIRGGEEQAMTFFSSGALLLTAGLAGTWLWMRSLPRGQAATSRPTLSGLGVRNATRHATRSLLTAGLLASATFVIVAVASFYRNPEADFLDHHAGSGGFSLLGESDVPLFQDLNSERGRDEVNLSKEARAALGGVSIFALRLRQGEDASCLNLYQPRKPRILGVPDSLVTRGGFRFAASEALTPEVKANPWLLLRETRPDGAIPTFGEMNTVKWILHSGLGQEMTVPDENGNPVKLRFVGLFEDSIFQSELLVSETSFLKLYPRQEGYSFFLIQTPPGRSDDIKAVLETGLADQGFTVTPTAQRLAAYLAVENSYLATFQALGGLGLLLGALGLAVVLIRSAWERRGELALLRALGFRVSALKWLILVENVFLLALGLSVGTLAALLAVGPHLLERDNPLPWPRMLGFLAAVLLTGLAAGAAAVTQTLRAPLLPALRRE
jgi:ABC-type antimicrobial peptide transport system permease subunit